MSPRRESGGVPGAKCSVILNRPRGVDLIDSKRIGEEHGIAWQQLKTTTAGIDVIDLGAPMVRTVEQAPERVAATFRDPVPVLALARVSRASLLPRGAYQGGFWSEESSGRRRGSGSRRSRARRAKRLGRIQGGARGGVARAVRRHRIETPDGTDHARSERIVPLPGLAAK